jgi:putative ABC transport system permease protein
MAISTLVRTLFRSPAGPLLLAAQVALGVMIFANVGYVVYTRFETTGRPTGMDLENVFWIWSQAYAKDYNQQAAAKSDLEYLNSLPGVVAAAATNTVPQTFDALRSPVSANPDLKGDTRQALYYEMTERGIAALGLRLTYGRPFGAEALAPPSAADSAARAFGSEVIVTETLAAKMFGAAGRAVGKPLYFGALNGGSATIVGVVERLQAGPYFGPDSDFVNEVVLTPAIPAGKTLFYIVRTLPGHRDAVMNQVQREFESLQHGRYIQRIRTLAFTAKQGRTDDRNGAVILAVLSSFVLAVTMLGLFGFASFAVTSRSKEIGIRRAIGATRADILRYFLAENVLITSAGIVAGSIITLAFALQLSMLLEMPRLPATFLTGAMVLVWISGLVAAVVPALRGARIPPAVATRSV